MARYNIVVKPGQVWSNKSCGTHKITRVGDPDAQGIQGRRVYAMQIQDGVEDDLERHFGYVNEDGTPSHWDDGWKCEEPESSFSKPKTYQSDLDFFKAVAPGRCPCDIAKVDCWIHR